AAWTDHRRLPHDRSGGGEAVVRRTPGDRPVLRSRGIRRVPSRRLPARAGPARQQLPAGPGRVRGRRGRSGRRHRLLARRRRARHP
ncbi:MAG: Putative dioxygenase, partial [uncultured Thermomicrobiales bacterium]